MIKKLQRKFIIITMSSLFLVMLLIVLSINGINLYQMYQNIDGTMDILSENKGQFPMFDKKDIPKGDEPRYGFHINPETPFKTRYFVATISEKGVVQDTDTGHIRAISSTDAQTYAKSALKKNRKSGFIGIYRYQLVKQSSGSMIIFIDCREQLDNAKALLLISLGVAIATLLLVFLLVSIFSKKAIKPIIESTEKQKQFITDAGHEIKTPIAIISANADVLELTGGKNEWITSIRNQTTRLDKLVKNMLMLSKMEEGNIKLVFSPFDISKTFMDIAGPFEIMAETQNKNFLLNIQPGLKINGDESSIGQLISTLADNAIKYSKEEGTIKISLTPYKKGVKLEVYNTTEPIDPANLDKLFDRFYRSDSSRSRETGGYGIGLSIAKSIVEAHHGKITVKSDDGNSIRFTIVL
ncbi:sensor histidine kinase [Anaeromicropila herbilytica]|uniref:histidine kinase n=1 Tax=Anaeromicropila herbilytica TaxID=2785025 RepID=A0A7R7IEN4_9FIRM|nr:HAMP domain-containing sensor histidine kinase [Anaeromicropila herbilytica]BCN32883.1 two-component sensor histidine kinase [Anaeromicropila herbilytica]